MPHPLPSLPTCHLKPFTCKTLLPGCSFPLTSPPPHLCLLSSCPPCSHCSTCLPCLSCLFCFFYLLSFFVLLVLLLLLVLLDCSPFFASSTCSVHSPCCASFVCCTHAVCAACFLVVLILFP